MLSESIMLDLYVGFLDFVGDELDWFLFVVVEIVDMFFLVGDVSVLFLFLIVIFDGGGFVVSFVVCNVLFVEVVFGLVGVCMMIWMMVVFLEWDGWLYVL